MELIPLPRKSYGTSSDSGGLTLVELNINKRVLLFPSGSWPMPNFMAFFLAILADDITKVGTVG